jgi:hypothetical protein
MLYYNEPFPADLVEDLKCVEEKHKNFSGSKSVVSAFVEDAVLVDDFGGTEHVIRILKNLVPIIQSNFGVKIDIRDYLAFIVRYSSESEELDSHLDIHADESSITIDICIGESFEGGELIFDAMLDTVTVPQKPGYITIFHGNTPHFGYPVTGIKLNLLYLQYQTERGLI